MSFFNIDLEQVVLFGFYLKLVWSVFLFIIEVQLL